MKRCVWVEPVLVSVSTGSGGQRERLCAHRRHPGRAAEKPEDLAPITTKKDKPEFWFQFCGSGERVVDKQVAIYVAATIVNETAGRGLGQQAIVMIKHDPTTVADVISVIERLCGPAGWQHLLRKAGIRSGPGA